MREHVVVNPVDPRRLSLCVHPMAPGKIHSLCLIPVSCFSRHNEDYTPSTWRKGIYLKEVSQGGSETRRVSEGQVSSSD